VTLQPSPEDGHEGRRYSAWARHDAVTPGGNRRYKGWVKLCTASFGTCRELLDDYRGGDGGKVILPEGEVPDSRVRRGSSQ
jgi:hypothetical protein